MASKRLVCGPMAIETMLGKKKKMGAREALLAPNELNRLVAGTIAGCQRNTQSISNVTRGHDHDSHLLRAGSGSCQTLTAP